MACEETLPGLCVGSQEVQHKVVHVDEDVAVGLHDVLGVRAVRGHPAHAHQRFQCQVLVRILKVLDDDVVKNLALLLHHLVEDRLRIVTEQKERDYANVAVRALVSPGLADGLSGVELLVVCADEDQQEGRDAFAFLRLVDQEVERMWIERACPDVAERDVFRQSWRLPANRDRHVADVGIRGPGAAEVPQSAGPTQHREQVQTGHFGDHIATDLLTTAATRGVI